jgi:hypothetical protein
MRWRILLALLVLGVVFLPAGVSAQSTGTTDDGDLLLRINAPVHVGAAETVGTVIVISGDVTVDGTIRDSLIVIDGTATVTGRVGGDLTVISGNLVLQPTATAENVFLYRSTLVREAGATITGTLNERSGFSFSLGAGVLWMIWAGMSVAVLAGGLLFAVLGNQQLSAAAGVITSRPLETALTTLLTWVALPVVAVLLMVTVIGIPLGLAMFVFLMPALWFLGYLVAGAGLGFAVTRLWSKADYTARPVLPVLVGLIIFQMVGLIPAVGGLVVFLAGLAGGGALVYRSWRILRGTGAPRAVAAPAPM